MEYISKEAAIRKFEKFRDDCEEENDERAAGIFNDCICELQDIPAADVAPVVHGEWVKEVYIDPYGADWTKYRCNLCGRVEIKKEPYCNCGAKMDGGKQP